MPVPDARESAKVGHVRCQPRNRQNPTRADAELEDEQGDVLRTMQLVEPGEGQKFGLIAICVIVDDRRAAVPRSYEVRTTVAPSTPVEGVAAAPVDC
jgi:hypothetical protein